MDREPALEFDPTRWNHSRGLLRSPLPACGERSDREAVRVRGTLHKRKLKLPLTPTLSPQAGRGSSLPSLLLFQSSWIKL